LRIYGQATGANEIGGAGLELPMRGAAE
jgi:hypothetical protein